MADILDLKRWLDDCDANARKQGMDDDGVLLAFLDKVLFLLIQLKIKLLEKGT